MIYFFDTFLWNGTMDINRGNRRKTRGLRNVALQANIEDLMGGQIDQQSSDGTNEEERHQLKST